MRIRLPGAAVIAAAIFVFVVVAAPVAWSQGLSVGYSWASCHSFNQDLDHDGLYDFCENALAQAFAPGLQAQVDGAWDTGVVMNGVQFPARVGGDYGFVVQTNPFDPASLRLAYLPAYYYDQGGSFSPHSGDSEFILIDVGYNPSSGRWEAQRIFLSAHCGTTVAGIPADPNCKWWDVWRFQWVDGVTLGAPIVWVSTMKHANYYSQDACTHQSGIIDECPSSQYFYRFPVAYAQQNLGSADFPTPWRSGGWPTADCLPPFWNSARLGQLNPGAYSARECWWGTGNAKFTGWLTPFGTFPPAYGAILRDRAGFDVGQSVYPPPPPPVGPVSVYGTTEVPADSTCGYVAAFSGGTGPFYYRWTVDGWPFAEGSGLSGVNIPNYGSPYTVGVTVTDAYGLIGSGSLSVTTYAAPPGMVCVNVQ